MIFVFIQILVGILDKSAFVIVSWNKVVIVYIQIKILLYWDDLPLNKNNYSYHKKLFQAFKISLVTLRFLYKQI